MKKLLLTIFVFLVLVAGILIFNTVKNKPSNSSIKLLPVVEIDETEIISRFQKSIQFKTQSFQNDEIDSTAFRQFHVFLNASFPLVFTKCEFEMINNLSILLKLQGKRDGNPVLFMAHQDVVPIASPGQWLHDPFSGVSDGEYIWGRGTMDDKFSLMALLEALEIQLSNGFEPERTMYFAFGHDEEVGGKNGAMQIAQHLEAKGVILAMVIDEGGSVIKDAVPGLRHPVGMIGIAEKGYLTVKLTARSAGGHSSMPGQLTAAGKLAKAVTALEQNQMPAKLTKISDEMLDAIAPEMSFFTRVVFSNKWLFKPIIKYNFGQTAATNAMIRTTTAFTVLSAGLKENVLPTEANAIVNFRILPGDNIEQILDHIKNTIDGDIEIETFEKSFNSNPSKISNIDCREFQLISETIREIFPNTTSAPFLVLGGTDARHFEPICDNIYRFNPFLLEKSELSGLHGINERISRENYLTAVRFFMRLYEKI